MHAPPYDDYPGGMLDPGWILYFIACLFFLGLAHASCMLRLGSRLGPVLWRYGVASFIVFSASTDQGSGTDQGHWY